jgi:hypothetical protein
MYGSIRACCASTTDLADFSPDGILWGDRPLFPFCSPNECLLTVSIVGMGEKFRHAGFSSDEPQQIIPAELYCGRD